MTKINAITTESLRNVSPETIAAVLTELQRASENYDVEDIVKRIVNSGGLLLAAANAARRAYQQKPDLASLTDLLGNHFSSGDPDVAADRAGRVIRSVRCGKLDLTDDVVREQVIDLMEALSCYTEGTSAALCEVAKLACFAPASLPHHHESLFVECVQSMVEHLDEDEARTFMAELERLAQDDG